MHAIRKIKLEILVNIFKENSYYIAFSPVLQIATQGKTLREVNKRFGERLEIFFESAIEKGNLEDQLQKLGWNVQDKKINPPNEVNIPTALLASQKCKSTNFSYAI